MNKNEFIQRAKSVYQLTEFVDQIKFNNKEWASAIKLKDIENDQYLNFILHPIICPGDTTFLYAGKGLGKTVLAMSIAFATALGRALFGPIKSMKSYNTMYVDGEIGEKGLASRIAGARRLFKETDNDNVPIWFLSDRLNLYTIEGRQAIESEITRIKAQDTDRKGIEFIILDNLT